MKTAAMRHFIGMDVEEKRTGKTKGVAKRIGHGVESVSGVKHLVYCSALTSLRLYIACHCLWLEGLFMR